MGGVGVTGVAGVPGEADDGGGGGRRYCPVAGGGGVCAAAEHAKAVGVGGE